MELIPLLEQAKTSRGALSHAGLVFLLSLERREDLEALFAAAYDVKCRFIGRNVSLRGLIEMGNICSKDCYYCGIRRSNCKVSRFQLTPDDVVAMAMEAYHARYGSIAIQSGEIESDAHTAMITEILRKISAATNGGLGITLSLGEQTEDVYRQWFEAGAHRYLLRIEEANEARYRALHPAEGHDYQRRSACLDTLRRIGYQVGSGMMIGSPGQTDEHLYEDIRFLEELQPQMIGIGPFLPATNTPFENHSPGSADKTILMLSLLRLRFPNVLLPATTALATLCSNGMERAILAGANVVMPNVSPVEQRKKYSIYDNKKSTGAESAQQMQQLENRLNAIGYHIDYGRGDYRN